MNERIKLLAEQADPVATIGNWGRVEWSDNVYPQLGDKMYAAIDLQKFAELIVRECIDYCKGHILPKDVAEQNGLTYNDGVGDCAIGLEEHFGVEE